MKKLWETFETGCQIFMLLSLPTEMSSEGRQHIPNGVISSLNPFIKCLSVMQWAHSAWLMNIDLCLALINQLYTERRNNIGLYLKA